MTWAVMGIMATDAIWWMMNWTVLYVSDGDKNKGRNKREDDSGCDGTMAMDALTMSRLMRVTVTRTMVGTSIRTWAVMDQLQRVLLQWIGWWKWCGQEQWPEQARERLCL
jgi:hypothetical protein